jgi:UDP-N-acetylglucosamine acyltransferase
MIHSTAVIEGNVIIDKNAAIGPYCVIKGDVRIGENTQLLSHVSITGSVQIGKNNILYPFCSIGSEPQDIKFQNEESVVIIGDNNYIREYVTINGGSKKGNDIKKVYNKTAIGNNCYLMISSHVGHDAILEDYITLSNNVAVAGHVAIDAHSIIGGNSAIHQSVHIGSNCMIGGMCAIASNVPPFSLIKNEGNKISGVNIIGLKRAKFSTKEIMKILNAFSLLAKNDSCNLEDKLKILNQDATGDSINKILSFIKNINNRGICHFEDRLDKSIFTNQSA